MLKNLSRAVTSACPSATCAGVSPVGGKDASCLSSAICVASELGRSLATCMYAVSSVAAGSLAVACQAAEALPGGFVGVELGGELLG